MALTSLRSSEKTFICYAGPNATRVFLAGDFNDWRTAAAPMTKTNDGSWRAKARLAPGEHQYKFIVDGQWVHDQAAERQVLNSYGTLNSVIRVS